MVLLSLWLGGCWEWNHKSPTVMFLVHLGGVGSTGRDYCGIWGTMFSGFRSHLEALPVQDSSSEHPMSSGLGIQKNTKEIKILVLDNWGICSFIEREDQQVSVIAIIYWVLPLWLCHSTDRCFLCIVTVILTATLWARFCDYSHFHMRKLKLKIWIETQSYTHRLVWLKSLCSVLSPASKVDI